MRLADGTEVEQAPRPERCELTDHMIPHPDQLRRMTTMLRNAGFSPEEVQVWAISVPWFQQPAPFEGTPIFQSVDTVTMSVTSMLGSTISVDDLADGAITAGKIGPGEVKAG